MFKTVEKRVKDRFANRRFQYWDQAVQVILVTILLSFVNIGWAKSEQPLAPTYLLGVVTEISEKTIKVSGNTYKLDPEITISLDTGAKRRLNYLKPGNRIKYQLKHGRIEQVIIIQPN